MKSTSLREMNKHNRDFGFENFSEISCESAPAPPACTVATSWPVTGWKLCEVTKAIYIVGVLAGGGTGCARAAGDGGGLRGGGGF